MTLEELLAVAEIVEKLTNRYRDQEAAHKAALTEIRASFNARTSADGKRYEGILDTYRSELDEIDAALNPEREESTALVAKRLVKERDALREEVAAYRAEVAALQERLRASIARGDFAEIEVARLKAQAPKRSHPVKVGEWVECVGDPGCGTKRQVLEVYANWYSVEVGHRWTFDFCRPCDPPEASHATPAGKESAESVIRDSQMTEIKVGDVVEVFQASGKCTYSADIGTRGTVRSMSQPWETMADHRCVDLDPIDGFPEPVCAHVSISDVRKVPQ